MQIVIEANGVNKTVNSTKSKDIALARIQMAMTEEGDETIKDYLNDFTEVLSEIASESEENPSTDPKDYVDHIASHLTCCNTMWFIRIMNEERQLNPKDRDVIGNEILRLLEAEL